jgi:polyisoprenoid-binding protein YceI
MSQYRPGSSQVIDILLEFAILKTTGASMKISIVLMLLSSFVFAETGVEVDFKVTMGKTFTAKTKSVKGKVVQQNGELIPQGIVVDLKTLTTDMGLRDDHMKNKYLEVGKYPEAVLTTGKGKDGKGTGKIKIRGVEKDISGVYKILNDKEVEAKFDLNLPDYNITGIRYMGVGVKDKVNVRVVVPLEKTSLAAAPAKK